MQEHNCTAGFARLDITPPLGVAMRGRAEKRIGRGMIDPLYVNAVAFGQGDKAAVLLVLDMLGIYGPKGYEWPGQIAEKLGLSEEAVILCCTHSHTTPAVDSDAMYDDWLFRRLCDAATLALNDRKPVTDVRWTEGQAEGMAFVRRFKMKDGTVLTNPPQASPDILAPACETDQSMRVIRILRREGTEIVLVNFQSHPDCTGGELYSADYPGALRDRVESGRENVCCVYIDGAEGQMVGTDRTKSRKPIGREFAQAYGTGLGDMALKLLDKTVSTDMTGLTFGQRVTQLRTKRDPSRVGEAQRILALRDANQKEKIHPHPKFANYMVVEASQVCWLEERQLDYIPAVVSVIAFCGLALVGFPGEPFNEMGKQIRAASQYPVTCVCCQANGCHGYYPTADAYDQGSYETFATRLKKGAAEQLVQVGEALLASC